MMKTVIGADIVPTRSNEEGFKSGDINKLVCSELYKLLCESDLNVFNLEVPLTDKLDPIEKAGPALSAPTSTIRGFKELHIGMLTLANNHILDQGTQGLLSTIEVLDNANIVYSGVGNDLSKASQPYIVDISGSKIGFYCCVEHEFSLASESTPGANPFDPLESLDHIVDLKNKCDYVVCLYHGGKEYYRYPSPKLQKTCRKIVEKGADLVLCQHSHCIGCEEKYREGVIVYGQGNFLFDLQDNDFWRTGLLVCLNDELRIEYIPIVKDKSKVRLADKTERETIMNDFRHRSSEILEKGFIENHYAEFAKGKREYYLEALNGVDKRSFGYRILNRLSGGRYKKWRLGKIYSRDRLITIRNFTECEAHVELLLKGIEEI